MAVTLIVLSATLIATHAMGTVVNKIEQQVDMSIYLDQGTTDEQISKIVSRMTQLESVVEVTSTSPSEANKAAIEKILARSKDLTAKEKETYRQNLLDAPNKLPWTLNVKLVNLDNTQELEDFVNNDEDLKELLDKNNAPSYASERRDTIDKIAGTMNRVELIGLAAGGVFALIAILVVFNTIRMAIFNRKEEIYMMRLVGASRWFIVGPFVVEASIYGIIAAIIAGVIAYAGTFALQPQFGTTLDPTAEIMRNFWYLALCALLVAGILIGVISSLLATRKYLKQK
jgi:cell division transport system permease protein